MPESNDRLLFQELSSIKEILARVDERTLAMKEKDEAQTLRLNSHSLKIDKLEEAASVRKGQVTILASGAATLVSILVAVTTKMLF